MGYWTKRYVDGNSIIGDDILVSRNLISWSKTSLENMIGAEIEDSGIKLEITGIGSYWQSDTYISNFSSPKSQRVKRRIERFIDVNDKFFCYRNQNNSGKISFNQRIENEKYVSIPPSWINKWFILELDIVTKQISYYIRDGKL